MERPSAHRPDADGHSSPALTQGAPAHVFMKRLLAILIPIVALGSLIGWRMITKRQETKAQTDQRAARSKAAPVVSVKAAELRDIVQTYVGVGTVESPFNVKIATKITGRIDYLQLREGDRVSVGQVMARIDPAEIQADVSQKQAAFAEAQSRLAQAQLTQNPTNVSVATQIRQQAAGLTSAQADYNQASQNYASQLAAAEAAVTDARGRVNNANASIGNANAAIRSAQANLDNAQAKFRRIQQLYSEGFIAAQDVDDARTTVSVQQGALDVANGQLDSAKSVKDSAVAQRESARKQADIVATKGKADIEAARARVHQAEAALDFAKSNVAQRPAYQQNLAALRSAASAAEGALHNSQAQLKETTILSPINGFVTSRLMDPGSVATPGQPILAVQMLSQVWVTVPVPEEVSRKIVMGQPIPFTFDGLPGRTFVGKVTQLNPSADAMSRQFAVRALLDNPGNLIKPGMFARAAIEIDRVRAAVVVPLEAVVPGKDGLTVVTVGDDAVAHRRIVKTGASDSAGIAILEGVQAGERVVTLSTSPVKDGVKVRVGGDPAKRS